MQVKISEELYTILRYAGEESMRTGCIAISADHLMLGILRHHDNMACSILADLGLDLQELKKKVEKRLFREQSIPYSAADSLTVARSAQNAINMSAFESLKAGAEEVLPVHLLIALSRTGGIATADFFASCGITAARILDSLKIRGINTSQETAGVPENERDELRKSVEKQLRSIVLLTPCKKTTIVS